MSELPAERSRHLADELDKIEDAIKAQNDLKAAWVDTTREALKGAGFVGPEIAVELAKLRGAIKRRWVERKDPEKARKAAEKAEGTEIYFDQITASPRVRAREAENLAAAQPQPDPVTPHDPITGEIAAFAELSTLIETVTVLDRHGSEIIEQKAAAPGAPVIETGTGAAAVESCGSDEGIAVQTDSTLAGKQVAYPAAGAAEQGTAVCAESNGEYAVASQPVVEPGPQDTPIPTAPVVPLQIHRGLHGEPLTPLPKGPVDESGFPVMPDFLRAAQPAGNA